MGIFEKERWQNYELDLDLSKWWKLPEKECPVIGFIKPNKEAVFWTTKYEVT